MMKMEENEELCVSIVQKKRKEENSSQQTHIISFPLSLIVFVDYFHLLPSHFPSFPFLSIHIIDTYNVQQHHHHHHPYSTRFINIVSIKWCIDRFFFFANTVDSTYPIV